MERNEQNPDFNLEQELERLREITEKLDSPSLSLSDSLKYYEEGIRVYRSCREYIENAKGRVSMILEGEERDAEEIFG